MTVVQSLPNELIDGGQIYWASHRAGSMNKALIDLNEGTIGLSIV